MSASDVMMEWDASAFADASSSDLRLDGDFYGMPEDVFRGVTLPPDLVGSNPFCQPDLDLTEDAFGLAGKNLKSETFGIPGSTAFQDEDMMAGTCNDLDVCFQDSVRPPAAKSLPAMSFRLWAQSPAALAQRLYNFVSMEPGKIVKVSPSKFAFKADILQTVNGCLTPCRLKARIYSDDEDSKQSLVSFSKHSGDVLAFQKTVARALHDLTLEFKAAQEIPEGVFCNFDPQSPAELPRPCAAEPMLSPLLEMLQDDARCAEALAALTALANTNAVSVRAALGQLQWLKLLKAFASSSQVEISYPARRLESFVHEELHDGSAWGVAC